MKKLSYFIFAFFILQLIACNTSLDRNTYMNWIESSENEANQIAETANLRINCLYTPSDYLIEKEVFNGVLSKESILERRKELETTLYFKLGFETRNGKSILTGLNMAREVSKEREDYLRFLAPKSIKLFAHGEEISPSITHLVNNYGIRAVTELLIGFQRRNDWERIRIEYKNELIDTTEIHFSFDLNRIPELER
jgi:hypothetical protein